MLLTKSLGLGTKILNLSKIILKEILNYGKS